MLLEYLETSTFRDLPSGLWDHRLWFYRDLLHVMNEPISETGREGVTMYVASDGAVPRGVAIVQPASGEPVAGVAADDTDVARELTERIIRDQPEVRLVEVGLAGGEEPGELGIGDTAGGTAYFWTDEPALRRDPAEGVIVRELEPDDLPLFDWWPFPDGSHGWPEWPQYLANGLRYFGAIVDGRLVSVAGLCETTRRVTEIIAVGTMTPEERRKGYAALCCSLALSEGLAQSPYCTWSCNRDNIASRKTAEALGMHLASDVAMIGVAIGPGGTS